MEKWNEKVKKVCVILSSSRSGSSVFKKVLQSHMDIASLDGELEPLLITTKNGFPFNSKSDVLDHIDNKQDLLDLTLRYLRVPCKIICPRGEIKQRWIDRLKIQFPNQDTEKLSLQIDNTLKGLRIEDLREQEINKIILEALFRNETWKMSYYDNFYDSSNFKPFDLNKIEEPPFITPSLFSRKIEEMDLDNKTFTFKTPQDSYRFGLYEQLFPNAEIKYIHLTRGYAQTVNGLMDGWLSPVGFFSHDMSVVEIELKIKGYSDVSTFGKKWWKFDLPPNWKDFIKSDLIDVCANQWLQAHLSIINHFPSSKHIKFEDFIDNPNVAMKKVATFLSFDANSFDNLNLPQTMTTDKPANMRWKKRQEDILDLYTRQDIKELMNAMGYSSNPETWI